jgi:hypothetical protein
VAAGADARVGLEEMDRRCNAERGKDVGMLHCGGIGVDDGSHCVADLEAVGMDQAADGLEAAVRWWTRWGGLLLGLLGNESSHDQRIQLSTLRPDGRGGIERY